jgi:hypothetical protein
MRNVLLSLCLVLGVALAAEGRPPIVDEVALSQAERVASLTDTDPVGRMGMVLEARKLNDAALFALAGSHPGIVEQVVAEPWKMALDYIDILPAPDLHRIRRGETVIRSSRELRGLERERAGLLAEYLQIPKYKLERLYAVKIGPLDGRLVRLEVTVQKGKKKTFQGNIDFAWPSTPDRDERSRDSLARHFGARPSQVARAGGPSVVLLDPSFESGELGSAWRLAEGVMLGTNTPVAEVSIDERTALDGLHSLRFHATDKTRLFPEVVQRSTVTPGARLRLRAQMRAEDLRVEFIQRDDQVRMSMSFLDASGMVLGRPLNAVARLSTHTWELLEIEATAPANAAAVQVGLLSAVSGTAWFDGISIETL